MHETIGHLGIFVSGGVAKKEHAEFSSNIDLIDVLPPGLYEATFEARGADTLNDELAVGQWVMRCEARTLDDIRAMGGNSPEDERRFETAKRVSEMNLAAYQKYLQPWIKSMVTPQMAELMQNLHPMRVQYEAFSSQNPFMKAVEDAADKARDQRKPIAKDNPFLAWQEKMSKQIVSSLDQWRDSTEAASEAMFLAIYGSPALQAAVGVDPKSAPSGPRAMDPKHREMLQKRIAELKSKIGSGGLREAGIRALLYAGSARGMVDERSLEALRRLRQSDEAARVTLDQFKMLVREQFFMLLLDRRGSAGGHSETAARQHGRAPPGVHGDRGDFLGERGDFGRGGFPAEAGRRAVRAGRRRLECQAVREQGVMSTAETRQSASPVSANAAQ